MKDSFLCHVERERARRREGGWREEDTHREREGFTTKIRIVGEVVPDTCVSGYVFCRS